MDPSLLETYREMEDRHWWFLGRRRIFTAILDRYGQRMNKPWVLDVGTGTGAAIGYLSSYGEVVGLDADPTAVAYCRERGYKNVVHASTPPIPFEAERFSLVTGLDVVEHVEDDRMLVREMQRVLRPGGLCLIAVPAFRSLWSRQDEVAHHKRRYRKPEVEGLLEGAGLEPVRASYFNTLLFLPIAAIRLARRLPGLGGGNSGNGNDFEATGGYGALNALLARVFGSEAGLLTRANLPFGVSIFALGRKPGSAR